MSETQQWTISELHARYSLEPELNDVFVEGTYDREVLTAAFKAQQRSEIFYEIDSVNIPSTLLQAMGLTSGNKQRVIALARELETLPADARVQCLVDRDLDHWIGKPENTARLKWTIFCSIESHFLSKEVTIDIALTTARARIEDADSFFHSLESTLKTLYAMRLADKELDLKLRWVALKKYLGSTNTTIKFDSEKYIAATLSANSALGSKEEFARITKSWAEKFDCDIRMAARGHDYTELLAWAISEFDGHRSFIQKEAIERLFVLLAKSVPTLANELA